MCDPSVQLLAVINLSVEHKVNFVFRDVSLTLAQVPTLVWVLFILRYYCTFKNSGWP